MKPSKTGPHKEFAQAYWAASGMPAGSYYPHDTELTATAIRELMKIREQGLITPDSDLTL